jgi:hypothetical protein
VAGFPPRLSEELDLLGLEPVERHLGVFEEERGAHQVRPLLTCPDGGLV